MARQQEAQTGTKGKPAGRASSIRGRLIALAGLVLALLMAERAISIMSDRAERLETVDQQVLELASRGVGRFREIVATARGTLQALALNANRPIEDPDFCASLGRLAAVTHGVISLSIIQPNGIVSCSTAPRVVGIDLSQRDYFRIAMGGNFIVSSISSNYVSKRPLVLASQPVVDDAGDVTAVLTAQFDLDELLPVSLLADIDTSAITLLIDPEGTVISAFPDPTRWVGKDLRQTPLVDSMLVRTRGTLTSDGFDGIPRVYGFERLPDTNLRLAFGLSSAGVLAPVQHATLRAATTFLAACALIFIGLWLAGERLVVQPVQLLANRLASFGRGEGDESVAGQTRIAELEPLVAAFGAMARQLTQRESALRQANQQLLSLASLDPLTGVANRRAFDRALAALWQGPSRSVAMLMIDVDQFKSFNDMYGHGEGDVCLRRIAAALAASVRASDLVARLGGEEFALLMPDSDVVLAGDIATRLRLTIEGLDIRHAGAPSGRVTVSIGYAACHPGRSSEPADLLAAADEALYEAKRAGRNIARAGALKADSPLLRRAAAKLG